jgi:hypothetical protein
MNNAIDRYMRQQINDAVRLAMEYWPNAHLGTVSRREDMHSAFKMIRQRPTIQEGVAAVSESAYRHEDM